MSTPEPAAGTRARESSVPFSSRSGSWPPPPVTWALARLGLLRSEGVWLIGPSYPWNVAPHRDVCLHMAIFRLNHAVLYVRNLAETVAFYTDVLGFERIDEMTPDGFAGAAFLRAPESTNDHDLGLFEIGPGAGASQAGQQTVGLYHLAWEVDTLDELEATAARLSAAGGPFGAGGPRPPHKPHGEKPPRAPVE